MKAGTSKKEEYDKEPVFYCAHCNSLKIIDIDGFQLIEEVSKEIFSKINRYFKVI